MRVSISKMMETSGVKFGTSGARGLVKSMNDKVCYSYTLAFLNHLKTKNMLSNNSDVAIAGDLRPSTPKIIKACAKAISDAGHNVINCGYQPSPSIANFGLIKEIPTIMVTGSHIPADRNGIKYNTPIGEITKNDELGIKAQNIDLDENLFDDNSNFKSPYTMPKISLVCDSLFRRRFLSFFPDDHLSGLNIGFYQHSTVGREVFPEILEALGANIHLLGYSDIFLPVDTEAIRPEDVKLAKKWCKNFNFDAIVSADGDCDRPLLCNANGEWLRGDLLGVLAAQAINAEGVVTPVSCNSVLEKSGLFPHTKRTKIGSPFVIKGMQDLGTETNISPIVGYEANGGFLTYSIIEQKGKHLEALATRDALLPIICVLGVIAKSQISLKELCEQLPARYTLSDRLKEFPTEISSKKISAIKGNDFDITKANVKAIFGNICGELVEIDETDGLRFTFDSEEIIHLRPSGNAPELRCYNEASSQARVEELNSKCMEILSAWRN